MFFFFFLTGRHFSPVIWKVTGVVHIMVCLESHLKGIDIPYETTACIFLTLDKCFLFHERLILYLSTFFILFLYDSD